MRGFGCRIEGVEKSIAALAAPTKKIKGIAAEAAPTKKRHRG
jgi:hypothetical protein